MAASPLEPVDVLGKLEDSSPCAQGCVQEEVTSWKNTDLASGDLGMSTFIVSEILASWIRQHPVETKQHSRGLWLRSSLPSSWSLCRALQALVHASGPIHCRLVALGWLQPAGRRHKSDPQRKVFVEAGMVVMFFGGPVGCFKPEKTRVCKL